MKSLISTTFLLLTLLVSTTTAAAYDFESGGIYYNINGSQATVTFKGSGNVQTGHYSGQVVIPETVTHNGVTYAVTAIERRAFSNCTAPTTVSIPKTVTSIDAFSFSGSSGITSITVDSANPKYDSREQCNAIILTAANKLMAGCQNTVIPNSVTVVGNGAFWGCSTLSSVTIPSSVIKLEVQAFAYCSGLSSVTIGNSMVFIDESAFDGCTSLASVTLPASVNIIGRRAFADCNSLTDVYSYITDPSRMTVKDLTFYVSGGFDYAGRTLHVPQGSGSAYRTDVRWYPYFGHIVEDLMIGDVNLDGEVNIADVNVVIDLILDASRDNPAADVNADGEVTVADVNAIIGIISD